MGGFLLALPGLILLLGSAPPQTVPLVPGQRAAFELPAGSVRMHSFDLRAGQFVRLAVVQEGTDLAVAVIAPDGSRTDIDTAERQFGSEPASILADTGGTCFVEVHAKDAQAAARYAIESDVPRAADERDRTRLAAERALAEGSALARQWTYPFARAAVERFDAALAAWRAQGDPAWELEALLQRAAARGLLDDPSAMLAEATAALQLASARGDRRAEVRALGLIGGAHVALEDYDRAIETLDQALAVRPPQPDRKDEAGIVQALGLAHGRQGDLAKNVELARRSREMYRGLGDASLEAWAVMEVGYASFNAQDLQGAEGHFREALSTFRALGDRSGQAIALQSLSALRGGLGDFAGALALLEEGIALAQGGGHREGEAVMLLSMGMTNTSRGEPGKGLEQCEKALAIYREIGVMRRQAQTLNAMASALRALRQYERAEATLREALRLTKDAWTESEAFWQLAVLYDETGRPGEARDLFRRTAEAARAAGDHGRVARALYTLARIANDAGDLAEARAQVEAALDLIETTLARLTSPTLRASYAASARQSYELYVDVLMGLHRRQPGQGFDARALEAAELARARGLLDQLSEAGVDIRAGVDRALLDEERTIQDRLSAALDRQLRLSQAAHTDEQARSMARTVQSLTTEWDAVRAQIKARSPRFAELRDPPPSTTEQIRQQVLDEDTQLLEYALADKRSFVWVLSRRTIASYELPGRAEIEKAAREAHVRLGEPAHHLAPGAAAPDALARLSRMILGPAARSLTARRLLIVADGALHYVPFAALPHPEAPGTPLLARHEVVNAPSASVVAMLRRDVERPAAGKTLIVMADPVFDREDERLAGTPLRTAGARSPASPARDDTVRALRSAGVDGRLPRLPFTRREAEAILSLVPPRARQAALDFEASRATVAGTSLADFRLVHFATHGFLNSAQPDLSGIVLSLVDRDGGDTRGYLTTADVFNLHLNADMVVLSGCRTALGRELRGEGVVGLSRGFMHAGAPRVVASLWKVDDAATAELMKRFYRGILTKRLPPGAALRAAQLDLMRRPRFRDPFYWAAFQLQGEWR